MMNSRAISFFTLMASLTILATVYIMEYGFGLLPCSLCLWQRLPWWGIALLSAISLGFKPRMLQKIILLLLLISVMIALYHSLIEWGILKSQCAPTQQEQSVDSLLKSLEATPITRCDKPAFIFLRLSLAQWNMIASIIIFGMFSLHLLKKKQND